MNNKPHKALVSDLREKVRFDRSPDTFGVGRTRLLFDDPYPLDAAPASACEKLAVQSRAIMSAGAARTRVKCWRLTYPDHALGTLPSVSPLTNDQQLQRQSGFVTTSPAATSQAAGGTLTD
ncbi:MAG: hypothetical protein AAF384_11930 [Pseudomonadota bacterium]